jgi:hypothetical protein
MFVIPKKGYKVFDPARKDYLEEEGRDVGEDNSSYWIRRLGDGDITEDKAKAKQLADAREKARQEKPAEPKKGA